MKQPPLIEPSFADAIAAIEQAGDLPPERRSHWTCSLRQIAKAMDKPVAIIPARWTSARFAIGRLHHARVGLSAKTLSNHKSNVRGALLWFCQEQHVPLRGARLSPEWCRLHEQLADRRSRAVLSGLMRYCSARRIAPAVVDEAIIDDFMHYRGETTALAVDGAARRSLARVWNACAGVIDGWPCRLLTEPSIKAALGPVWEDFPDSLRAAFDDYLSGLTKVRRGVSGKRIRPCKESTIKTRRAELVAVAKMAVRVGVPIEDLTTLLHPAVVEKVLDAYCKKDGGEPKVFTIDLGWKILSVARLTGCVDDIALTELEEIRAGLEDHRQSGLTEKNLRLIRQVLTEGIWREVVNLPHVLMAQARALRDQAPVKAAVTAQIAVAIAVLTVAPVRLSNLVRIRLDENLIRPGASGSPYWLVFPHCEVKNRMDLNFEFDQPLTDLIEEYIFDFRPALLRGSNAPWLFPGEASNFKTPNMFSGQITDRIEKATGLRITAHQFRHAAAAIYLKHRPGEYEIVRRLLGHRNIQTTIAFYCGLETIAATQTFAKLVREQMTFRPEANY